MAANDYTEMVEQPEPEPEDEPTCGKPCEPHLACDECEAYWHRMRREGLWDDRKGWSDAAWRYMLR